MNAEQRFFLSILKDHVQGTACAAVPKALDWDRVYSYAEEQSLLGICYIQLRELSKKTDIPPETLEKFHHGFFHDAYVAANQQAFGEEVEELFRASEIPYHTFKGWTVKESWPVPMLRTMGDVDILIHTTDRRQSDSIMKQLRYKRHIDNHAVWTYYKKDIIIEIHDHMFYEHLMNDVDYRGYFDHAWENLDSEHKEGFHFLYLVAHLAKHTINNGIGFRAFLDLVFTYQNNSVQMDWNWIREELAKIKLLHFTEICLTFCNKWFGLESPIPIGIIDNEFFLFATDKIFRDGVFGLENEQNTASDSAKEITYYKGPYWSSAIKLTLHRLFPPYKDMQLVSWYSFVDGRPWLLPVAWAYRWGYILIHKKKYGEERILEPIRKKEIIEDRQRLMREWGL